MSSFGFQRLVQPLRIAPPGIMRPSEFVDDDEFAVAHDIVLVELGTAYARRKGLIDGDGTSVTLEAFVKRALFE